MSKRYGRTQKRKHLEAISQLLKENDGLYKSSKIRGERLDRLRNSYNRVVNSIIRHANNSSLIPPEENRVEYLSEYYRIPIREMINFGMPFVNESVLSSSVVEAVTLDLIDVLVKYDELKRCAHLAVRTKKGGYHYYISREAINAEDFDYLLEHICKTCRNELPKLFQEGKL